MSKIGKKPIVIPDGVEVKLEGLSARFKGPKGELSVGLHPKVKVEQSEKELKVSVPKEEDKRQRALWGTFQSLLENAVLGVTEGFSKQLEVIGVGYKAEVKGDKLVLALGFSHPVEFALPKGIEVKVAKNVITISGIDKQMVGQFAAEIREKRKPEPYKGKGVRYTDERVRRKAGKVVKAVGG